MIMLIFAKTKKPVVQDSVWTQELNQKFAFEL